VDQLQSGDWISFRAAGPAEEARRRFEGFYAGQDVVVGRVTERDLHFEAANSERDVSLVDRLIIDKRAGRIRSILQI
jgi:hypothetical protein